MKFPLIMKEMFRIKKKSSGEKGSNLMLSMNAEFQSKVEEIFKGIIKH